MIETVQILTDDLDGGKGVRTVAFGLDGASYEMELSARNLARFLKMAEPWVTAAHRVAATRPAVRDTASRERSRDIRGCARENGYTVPERGRIPAQIVSDYRQFHDWGDDGRQKTYKAARSH